MQSPAQLQELIGPAEAPADPTYASAPQQDDRPIVLCDVLPDDFIPKLRCPVTDGSVRWMSGRELAVLNAAGARGDVAHLDGTPIDGAITAALLNAEGSLAYRISEGILMMLPITAIATSHQSAARHGSAHRREKADIKSFYDRIGWTKSESGDFEDAIAFEDLRPASATYIRKAHQRLKRYLIANGDYLLDVASGPVQYPEYLAYSRGYQRRVCMDISIAALREARRKLGGKGIFILGDITHLPLQSDAMDAVISLHTIYHVPRDEQRSAFEELYRVLKPGRRGAIIYTFTDSLLMRWGFKPGRWYNALRHSLPARGIKRLMGTRPAPGAPAAHEAVAQRSQGVGFYFHAHPLAWFTSQTWSFPLDLVVWRSMDVQFMRKYIHLGRGGKLLLGLIYRFEEMFPRFTGRHGAYPLFIVRKDA